MGNKKNMFARREVEEEEDQTVSLEKQQIELGEKLRQAREAKGLSLDDVMAELNIRTVFFKAIEEGNFDALPSGVYRKTYLKSYIEFLGLETPEFMKAGSSTAPVNDNKTENTIKVSEDSSKPTAVIFLVALLIIGGGYYYWNEYANKQSETLRAEDVAAGSQLEEILSVADDVNYEMMLVVTDVTAIEILDTKDEIIVSKNLEKGEVLVLPKAEKGELHRLFMASPDHIELYINGDYINSAKQLARFTTEGKYIIDLQPSELLGQGDLK